MSALIDLRDRLRSFAAKRDWEQFHSPKNLAMALIVEAGELVEHFQWLTEAESQQPPPDTRAKIEEELADVLLYLIRLADRLGVDLEQAARAKIERNAKKYPADKVRSSAKKYTEY